jgi:signal transduction histidine kinase
MINKSIFLRLLFSYMLTVLLGLCVVGLLTSYLTKEYYMNSKTEDMLRQARNINLTIQQFDQVNDDIKNVLSFLDKSYDSRIWLFDREGKIVATSSQDEVSIGKEVERTVVEKINRGEDTVFSLNIEENKKPMLSVVVPWGKDDQIYGGIILHSPITGINDAISNMREMILWVTLFGVLLSLIVASYMSWSISRPLQKIERVASKIGMGDYSQRIDIESKDEIGELAATINHMVDELKKSDEEKRRLEQIRLGFLANVSHELRTPLTAMQGFLEALLDGLIDENGRQKYYEIIYNETLHMNRLIDDILDLVRLENKEIQLSRHPLDVCSFIQKIQFKFSQEAQEQNTEIVTEAAENLPKVYADPDRLEQILNNVVKNAVKFTQDGTITISAKEDGEYILISISDTGIGIPAEDLDLIWNRFYKVDRLRSRKDKGTGLGLAIVKELVELHEGKIEVQSEIDSGTVFHIWLPSFKAAQS